MIDLTENQALRYRLEEIVDAHADDADIRRQLVLIEGLKDSFRHSISPVAEAIPGREETYRYTCFQHAFELMDPPADIVRIATRYPHVYPSADFVKYMIREALTEVSPSEVESGNVVVYAHAGRIRHAGKVDGESIVSKWGVGHLWRHPVFEVPTRYGASVRFFRSLPSGGGVSSFMAYARETLGSRAVEALLRQDKPGA